MKPPRRALDEIAAAVAGRARPGHSEVYWWIYDRFPQLQPARVGRPQWQIVTDQLNELGLRDAKGALLKKANVRKTWLRVARDHAALSQGPRAKAPVTPPPTPTVAPARPAPPGKYNFVLATSKKTPPQE
jgi:hypothetical protein